MKMYKLLQLLVLCCLVFACTKDTFEDQNADQVDQRLVQDQYDNSYLGVYKGLFTTNDGLTRGSVVIELTPDNIGIAHLTLSSGEVIELRSGKPKLTVDGNVGSLRFSSEGLGAVVATMNFSVEGDGVNPSIANVVFDNKESDILIAKNLSRAPLTPITGTYVRTAGTGGFPNNNRTWNMMSIGTGDQNFAVQITYGNRTYQIPAGNSSQSGCVNGGELTTCNIAGTASFLGHNIAWSGTHTYATANNETCSAVSGTWNAPTFNGSSGTFVSDNDCSSSTVANDFCADAIVIGVGTYNGSSANATNTDAPGTCTTVLNTGPGVWLTYTPAETATITVSTAGSSYDTKLGVFSGSCGALVCVAGNDDFGTGLQSQVTFTGLAGTAYYFYLTGYLQSTGPYTMTLSEVILPPAPANDLCSGATTIACGGTASGNTDGATSDDLTAFGCSTTVVGSDNVKGVWYVYTATADKSVTVSTEGSNYDTHLKIFTGSCGAYTCVTDDDDSGTTPGLSSIATFSATNGQTYYIYIGGYENASGNYALSLTCIDPPPPSGACVAASIACGGSVSGTTVGGSTADAPATCTTALNTSPGVWYTFSTPTAKQVTVNTVGSNFDTKLGVFTGACNGLVCVAGNDDGPTGVTSQVIFNAAAGTTYYFYVTGFSANTGNYTLNVTCADPPPPTVFSLTPGCGTTLVDHGGDSAYANNRTDNYVIDAGAGNVVRLPFTVFNLERTWDFLRIYNSNDGVTLGTEINSVNGHVHYVNGAARTGFTGTGTGTGATTGLYSLQGQTVVSSGRYLIIRFTSDTVNTAAGFYAIVGCAPARSVDDSHQKTSATFTPPMSPNVPKVIGPQMTEEQQLQEYERKKLQDYNSRLQAPKKKVFATEVDRIRYNKKYGNE